MEYTYGPKKTPALAQYEAVADDVSHNRTPSASDDWRKGTPKHPEFYTKELEKAFLEAEKHPFDEVAGNEKTEILDHLREKLTPEEKEYLWRKWSNEGDFETERLQAGNPVRGNEYVSPKEAAEYDDESINTLLSDENLKEKVIDKAEEAVKPKSELDDFIAGLEADKASMDTKHIGA